MKLKKLILALTALCLASLSYAAEPKPDGQPHSFTFGGPNGEQFLLDGQPFQIRAGEIHPQRVPRKYWRHRIQCAKAMGLNTISLYTFWNGFEQPDGSFDFKTGNRDIAEFIRICAEEEMWVFIRPGPYVCGEWDLGGLPPYLLKDPNAKLRTMEDANFMHHQERYLRAISLIFEPLLLKHGGPILLTQLENEYGSYDRKHESAYMQWLKDFWTEQGFGPFSTADGTTEEHLRGVALPGVATGLDPLNSDKGLATAKRINPGVPVFSSESYPGWLRRWGEGNWAPSKRIKRELPWLLKNNHSFSIFVFHGGTNFGFTAGGNGKANKGADHYMPGITSYDFGAPVGEQGVLTPEYYEYREFIMKYIDNDELPPAPAPIPTMEIAPFTLEYVAPVKTLSHPSLKGSFETPPYFESFDQNQGMAIYRAKIPAGEAAELTYTFFHDYGHVFIDGELVRTVDRRDEYKDDKKRMMIPARSKESTLEIWVEAMGHINFSITMESDRKGLYGPVLLDGKPITGWEVTPIPLDVATVSKAKASPNDNMPGGIFRAEFKLDQVADTFIDMSKFTKGTLYVNGVNLGRYWNIGPQLRLYCPASVLRKGNNTVTVVELVQSKADQVRGCTERNYEFINEKTKNTNNVW
ncbi:beta-galactosidase [Coraliomargarita sp. SDUM461003]|uniref:Beta-galactosidase n=1 Tax=Thalassobacterium maritimum TaxID=3041265 RepID=A0ABU1ATB8_9BACT|nr:beta-galactosidase [Coraliomargarita sp. SDUM461003]MDQ8206390.1 beta-galactosidase [Coraliomargarita sp. SDUM461003]